jgi:hypothetical protein
MKKFAAAFFTISACIGLFALVNTIHFQFLPVHVVLYDAMLDAVIAMVLVAIAILLLRHRLT